MRVAIEVNGKYFTKFESLKDAKEWKEKALKTGTISDTDICTYHKWVKIYCGYSTGYSKVGKIF